VLPVVVGLLSSLALPILFPLEPGGRRNRSGIAVGDGREVGRVRANAFLSVEARGRSGRRGGLGDEPGDRDRSSDPSTDSSGKRNCCMRSRVASDGSAESDSSDASVGTDFSSERVGSSCSW
jgi:hypothetical protein